MGSQGEEFCFLATESERGHSGKEALKEPQQLVRLRCECVCGPSVRVCG